MKSTLWTMVLLIDTALMENTNSTKKIHAKPMMEPLNSPALMHTREYVS